MNKKLLSRVVFISGTVFMTTSVQSTTLLEEYSRQGKQEYFLTAQSMSGDKTTAYFLGAIETELEIDDFMAFGGGYGKHLTDFVNLNTELLLGSTEVLGDSATFVNWNLGLDYNFMKTRLTPLVTGGIGIINFRTNTSKDGVTLLDSTNTSYYLGGGFRWDVTDSFFVKGIYKATWTKLFEESNDTLLLNGINLNVGYIF